jgi:hypothetical protein
MTKSKVSGGNPTTASQTPTGTTPVSEEERRRMIAENAYYRAQQRGFNGGQSIDDWLAAEREVNRLLPNPQQQKQELAAYQTLRTHLGHLLGDLKDASAEAIHEAVDTARGRLRQLEEYTADTVEKAVTSVEKEMIDAGRRAGARLENVSARTADLLYVWRDRGSQFLARAASGIRDWTEQASARLGQQTYRAGEIAAAGTLECSSCGKRIMLETPAHVPLCPKCRQGEFRRVS